MMARDTEEDGTVSGEDVLYEDEDICAEEIDASVDDRIIYEAITS